MKKSIFLLLNLAILLTSITANTYAAFPIKTTKSDPVFTATNTSVEQQINPAVQHINHTDFLKKTHRFSDTVVVGVGLYGLLSLIFGVLALLFSGFLAAAVVFGVAAIILGVVGDGLQGRLLALLGFIFGIIGIVLALLV